MTDPSAVEYLSQITLSDHSDDIALQVRTILASKGKTRRRFCVLEVRESGSGELVGELLRTTYGLVSVHQTRTRRLPGGDWSTFRLQQEPLIAAVTGELDVPGQQVGSGRVGLM